MIPFSKLSPAHPPHPLTSWYSSTRLKVAEFHPRAPSEPSSLVDADNQPLSATWNCVADCHTSNFKEAPLLPDGREDKDPTRACYYDCARHLDELLLTNIRSASRSGHSHGEASRTGQETSGRTILPNRNTPTLLFNPTETDFLCPATGRTPCQQYSCPSRPPPAPTLPTKKRNRQKHK